jgi:hypothetical protein
MKQLTKEEAIEMHDGDTWKDWSDEQIVAFQLDQERVCIPWDVFKEAMSNMLGRPILTTEFADRETLRAELEGILPPPTFKQQVEQIINIFTRR